MKLVILVDENDCEVGQEEKLRAHEHGLLHRAFSIFIFNNNKEMLLQQRAFGKYHSGGLWSNACCGHPEPGQDFFTQVHKRLYEEMNFDCPLDEQFTFLYRTNMENNLIEYEFDHVVFGFYEGLIHPNPQEVAAFKWISRELLRDDINKNPTHYTYWFKELLLMKKFMWPK